MRPAISSRVHRGIPLAVVVAAASALVLTGCATRSAGPPPATTASIAPTTTATAVGVPVVIPIDHCPPVVGPGHDVRAAHGGAASLLPSSLQVSAALVCRYSSGTGTRGQRLARELRLPIGKAEALAAALRTVRIVSLTGPVHCPADLGDVTVIAFTSPASRSTPDTTTDLRWATTGCQWVDNGRIRTSQVANPSFWRFEAVFRALIDRTPRPAATD